MAAPIHRPTRLPTGNSSSFREPLSTDPRRAAPRIIDGRRGVTAAPAWSGVVNWERLLACLLAIAAPLGVVVAIILRYPAEMHQLWQRLLTP